MKTELTVLPDVNGNAISIYEGKALELREPKIIAITGDITAVANYVAKRKISPLPAASDEPNYQPINEDLSIVIVDKEKQTIQLQVAPNNYYSTTVTAELKDSEELKAFHINETKLFDKNELTKLLRFNKRFFTDLDLHEKLLKSLINLKVESTVNSNVGNDQRGNKNVQFDKKVNTELPDGFFLVIPIFKNQDAIKFFVELSLDSSEGATRFWLESVELEEIRKTKVDAIFAEQLKTCEGLVIINK